MHNINDDAKNYVKNLFAKINTDKLVSNSGTDLGNLKSNLLREEGLEFIKKYDLAINKVIREELYSDIKA